MSIYACGHCGADLQKRGGCATCKSNAMLSAVGIRRRRGRATPWAVLLLLFSVALIGAPVEEPKIIVVPTGDMPPPSFMNVTVYPGQSARVIYAEENATEAPPGPATQAASRLPLQVQWEDVGPPAVVWLLMAFRLASIVLGKRPLIGGRGAK